MKKLLITIVLLLTTATCLKAQGLDDFYIDWDNNRNADPSTIIALPNAVIGSTSNSPAPLGSGLLILTALGTGYAVSRKQR